jgi:uncharacterized glyoxalase superfamily protein PhnB
MTKPSSARASVEVAVDPLTAFKAFTEEIGQWWVPGPINYWDSTRAVTKRIEPGIGGRILEVYADGALELGRITVWEPGQRLVYRSSVDDTEVDVRFEAVDDGTKVSVEQYVLPGGDAEGAALFWQNVLRWLVPWCADRDPAREPRTLARLAVALYYSDPGAAARWLADVFGLRSWDRVPEEGDPKTWIEMHVGNASVILFELDGKWSSGEPVTHAVWVYVDDLEAHLAHAEARGARIIDGITQHGFRSYTAEDLEGHHWTFVQAGPFVSPDLR